MSEPIYCETCGDRMSPPHRGGPGQRAHRVAYCARCELRQQKMDNRDEFLRDLRVVGSYEVATRPEPVITWVRDAIERAKAERRRFS